MQYATVTDVRVLPSRGPWPTKSGGSLIQRMQLPRDDVRSLFMELDQRPETGPDIRGLRIYTVTGIPSGTVGAREFHRIRTEIVFASSGTFRWSFTDVNGSTRELSLDASCALLIPPFVLHEYRALEENGGLVVLATTTFEPGDVTTHDSYPLEQLRDLQGKEQN